MKKVICEPHRDGEEDLYNDEGDVYNNEGQT